MPAKRASKKSSGGGASKSARKAAPSSRAAKKPAGGKSAAKNTSGKKPGARKGAAGKKGAAKRTGAPKVLAPGDIMIVNMIPRSMSNETHQDSEPHLTVNPNNPSQIVGSAFTRDPFGGPLAPIYVSGDGGRTWTLEFVVPSQSSTGDITVGFSGSGQLYAGILRLPGHLRQDILRTNTPSGPTPMNVLVDRAKVDQPFVQATTVGARDRVYVGNNDFTATGGRTATIEQSTDAARPTPAFTKVRIEARGTGNAGQDGPQVRPVCHRDGTVYAIFYGWRAFNDGNNEVTADVVVVRDDLGGTGATPFRSLRDPGDGLVGRRVAQGVRFIWDDTLGQQRMGGDVSIATDPRNSGTVYAAWGDVRPGTGYTLHVRRSTDRGVTWSPSDIRSIAKATNPSLAVNSQGVVGLLYQQVVGAGAGARWVTQLDRSLDGVNWSNLVLARVPASSPLPQFQPYIGDYDHLVSVGRDFLGIFSANNTPDRNHFPIGVTYQRNHDFTTRRLLANNNTTQVGVSIDPFFFKVSG
jgi:hypothetical protein